MTWRRSSNTRFPLYQGRLLHRHPYRCPLSSTSVHTVGHDLRNRYTNDYSNDVTVLLTPDFHNLHTWPLVFRSSLVYFSISTTMSIYRTQVFDFVRRDTHLQSNLYGNKSLLLRLGRKVGISDSLFLRHRNPSSVQSYFVRLPLLRYTQLLQTPEEKIWRLKVPKTSYDPTSVFLLVSFNLFPVPYLLVSLVLEPTTDSVSLWRRLKGTPRFITELLPSVTSSWEHSPGITGG